jgi:hypothetical protein
MAAFTRPQRCITGFVALIAVIPAKPVVSLSNGPLKLSAGRNRLAIERSMRYLHVDNRQGIKFTVVTLRELGDSGSLSEPRHSLRSPGRAQLKSA